MRWRDGHLLEILGAHTDVERLLVIDRPVSLVEWLVRRASVAVKGRRITPHRSGRSRATLTEVAPKIVVIDVAVPDLVAPIRRKSA